MVNSATAMTQAQGAARRVAFDGAIGAALGLLLICYLATTNLDMREMMANGREPIASLTSFVALVVAQSALISGLFGLAIRKFALPD